MSDMAAALTMEAAEAEAPGGWGPAPPVSEADLTGSSWTFGALGYEPYTPFLVLAPDGLIGNYQHSNEDLWQIVDGRLAFMSSRGVATTVFDFAETCDGRVTALCGRMRLVAETHFHVLRRIDHPARRVHPAPLCPERRARFLECIPRPKRPNLVVLRAGEGSLHPGWPRDLPEGGRNWDLCISFYGQDASAALGQAEYLTHQPHQRKFQALYDLFFDGSPLWHYERVMFPDDDLMMRWSDINLTFHIARKYALDLAQPSLLPLPGCFSTHDITIQRPGSLLRYVACVEIMCPAFSARALRICRETFRDSVSGFGLDSLWPTLLGSGRSRIGVIDAAGIIHTRPVGLSYAVNEALAEEEALLLAYRLSPIQHEAIEVRDPDYRRAGMSEALPGTISALKDPR